jgi:hypothetical protein
VGTVVGRLERTSIFFQPIQQKHYEILTDLGSSFLPGIVLFAYGDPPLFAAILAFFILAAALVRSDRALSTAAGSLLAWEVQWCVCVVRGRWE